MESFKDVAVMVSKKSPTLSIISCEYVCQKNWHIHYLLDVLNEPMKEQEHKIFSQNCFTLLWPWNIIKVIGTSMNK